MNPASPEQTEAHPAEAKPDFYGKWEPIDRAPKTGEWIMLGYCPEYMKGEYQGGTPRIAYWFMPNGPWIDCCGIELNTNGVFSPTHWMPLPPPPKE